MLGDQIDCRDVEAPRLDPPARLDRDPMVALAGGQEKDELVGREAIVERGHERDGGLAEARRGVGEEVLALGQTRRASTRKSDWPSRTRSKGHGTPADVGRKDANASRRSMRTSKRRRRQGP